MSIDQIMFFALGLLTALLFTLALVPALSRRAMRLARKRMELLVPLSEAEIRAERDLIRAAHAVQIRQLEQKLEAAADAQARLAGDLGRRTAESVALAREAAASKAELESTRAELAAAEREIAELRGQLGTALITVEDEDSSLQKIRDELTEMKQRLATEIEAKNDLKAELAGLDAMKAGVELQVAEDARQIEELRRQIALLSQDNITLTQERDLERHTAENLAKIRLRPAAGGAQPNGAATDTDLEVLREMILEVAAQVVRQNLARTPEGSALRRLVEIPQMPPASGLAEKSLIERIKSAG